MATLTLNEIKEKLPASVHGFIPENVKQLSPFIKMKRLPEIDDSLLILTEYMSLNISFTSPLLQAVDFLEQYHKYSLRAVLSVFPISNEYFDAFYNQIQNIIMMKYKKNVTRIMKMVYEMINVANCQKINEMKMYEEIFQQIKTELLLERKTTDPYSFNPSQFYTDKEDIRKILEFSQKYLNLNNVAESEGQDKEKIKKQNETFKKQAKVEIQKMTQKIKTKTISMMDRMNDAKVQFPYRPQNCAYDIIETHKILASFYSKVKIRNIQAYEDLQKKRFSIEKDLRKIFEEGLRHYKEETSFYARSLIEEYNRECKSTKANSSHQLTTSISSHLLNIQKRRGIDANDINMNFTDGSEMKPAIRNIRKEIKFDQIVKFHDMDTKIQQIVEIQPSSLPYGKVKNQKTNQPVSLDFDFDFKFNPLCYQKDQKRNLFPKNFHEAYKNKNQSNVVENTEQRFSKLNFVENMKKLETQFAEFKKANEQSERIFLNKDPKLQFNKKIFIQKNFIIECLFEHTQDAKGKVNKMLTKELVQKQGQKNPFSKKKVGNLYAQQQKQQKIVEVQSKHDYIYFKNKADSNQFYNDFSKLKQDDLERINEQNIMYENQRKIDHARRLETIRPIYDMKTYDKFCLLTVNPKTKKGGLDTKTFTESSKVYRYGLQIDLNWQNLTGIKKYNPQSQKLGHHKPEYNKVCKLTHPDLEKLNKFFFYVFKERYYRETKHVEENSEIPLLMTLESEAEFLNEKMVKKIITLIKKFDFFILWTLGDIITYEEKVQFGMRKAKMSVYVFAQNHNLGTGLIWQIRKRIDENFKNQNTESSKGNEISSKINRKISKYVLEEKIEFPFFDKRIQAEHKETVNEILCKIECVHRVLYDRHKRPLTVEKTIDKGRELWDELLKWK